jgi:hypothetical protein
VTRQKRRPASDALQLASGGGSDLPIFAGSRLVIHRLFSYERPENTADRLCLPMTWERLAPKVVALDGIWSGQGRGRTADLPIFRPLPSKDAPYSCWY